MISQTLDAKFIAETIECLCSAKGVDVARMLNECQLSRGVIANMKKGSMPSIDKICKISEYFDCSIDYIVGRTDNPGVVSDAYIGGDNNGVQAVKNGTVNVGSEQVDDTTKEISSILSRLTVRERTELMTMIYSFVDEHEKGE